jgi:flagellar protein FliO/FliZ
MELATILRALVSLAIVLGLLIGCVWLLRRGSIRLGGSGRPRTVIAIETATSLGDRRSLVIVNVEGRRLLIGVASGSVSLVSELTMSSNEDRGPERPAPRTEGTRPERPTPRTEGSR